MRPNCRNKSLNHVRLYLRLRGFIDNLRASNLDISVRIWAEEPRRFYGSPGGGVALKKHRTKPPESRSSLFPKGAQCLMIEDQGGQSSCHQLSFCFRSDLRAEILQISEFVFNFFFRFGEKIFLNQILIFLNLFLEKLCWWHPVVSYFHFLSWPISSDAEQ